MTDHDERDDYADEPWRGRLAPERIVRWPASALWVFGLMQLILAQIGLVFAAVMFGLGEIVDEGKTLGEALADLLEDWGAWAVIAAWLIATAVMIFVMGAATDLRRFRRYPRVMTATILMTMSIPCLHLSLLQLPFGIWVLVVLLRRDVRARFAANRHGTLTATRAEDGDGRASGTADPR